MDPFASDDHRPTYKVVKGPAFSAEDHRQEADAQSDQGYRIPEYVTPYDGEQVWVRSIEIQNARTGEKFSQRLPAKQWKQEEIHDPKDDEQCDRTHSGSGIRCPVTQEFVPDKPCDRYRKHHHVVDEQ